MGSNRQIRNCQTTGYFPEQLCNAGCESIKIHPAPSGGRVSSKSMFEKKILRLKSVLTPRTQGTQLGSTGIEGWKSCNWLSEYTYYGTYSHFLISYSLLIYFEKTLVISQFPTLELKPISELNDRESTTTATAIHQYTITILQYIITILLSPIYHHHPPFTNISSPSSLCWSF